MSPKSVFRSSPKNADSSFDNEEEVDVEQWSDSEETKSIKNENESKSRDSNQDTSEPPVKKKKKEDKPKFLKPKCNSEELLHVDCFLETKELWDKFNELGTEMIITKTGR